MNAAARRDAAAADKDHDAALAARARAAIHALPDSSGASTPPARDGTPRRDQAAAAQRAAILALPDLTSSTPLRDEVLAWPVTVDLVTAGRAFRLGKDASYHLARRGEFPVPVLRLGRRLVVTRASVLDALGIEDTPATPRVGLASSAPALVNEAEEDIRTPAPPGGGAVA
jgi:hypothetical protein